MVIKGYPNYEIDEMGQVYSRNIDKNMSLVLNSKTGYLQVILFNKGVGVNHQVHRLVASHFIHNEHEKSQVNHKNGIKTDNRVENLEWVTDSENKLHCYESGLKDKNILSRKVVQKDAITGEAIKVHNSANSASRDVGVGQGNITNCCKGRCNTVGGYSWSYYSP